MLESADAPAARDESRTQALPAAPAALKLPPAPVPARTAGESVPRTTTHTERAWAAEPSATRRLERGGAGLTSLASAIPSGFAATCGATSVGSLGSREDNGGDSCEHVVLEPKLFSSLRPRLERPSVVVPRRLLFGRALGWIELCGPHTHNT